MLRLSRQIPHSQGSDIAAEGGTLREEDESLPGQSKPAKALHEAGIPSDTIVNLNAACLCPGKLASKEALAQVLGQLDEQTFASALKMIIPSINLSDR